MTLDEIRELLNGIWAMASFCMVVLLTMFILIRRTGERTWEFRLRTVGWWRDAGVQVAGALLILIFGHMLRSGSQWIQFAVMNSHSSSPEVMEIAYRWATIFFIPATLFAIVGKLLSVWSISPEEWSLPLAFGVLVVSCLVPLLVFWLF